jgi:hypothetical protein
LGVLKKQENENEQLRKVAKREMIRGFHDMWVAYGEHKTIECACNLILYMSSVEDQDLNDQVLFAPGALERMREFLDDQSVPLIDR